MSVTIDRPREEVFAYLLDIANHAEFCDHFLVDWRLTREDSVGRGAGVRFKVKAPGNRFPYADATFIEVEPPRRIVEAGRMGKFNRVRVRTVYELEQGPAGTTRVTLSTETRPHTLADRILESLGQRWFLRRAYRRALRRLRSILEEGKARGRRVTVAGR